LATLDVAAESVRSGGGLVHRDSPTRAIENTTAG
jgi:hypothetical protein